MPLNQQLKSEMTGILEDTIPQPELSDPIPDQMRLLLSIESQLKGLNDNILGLRQAVADSSTSQVLTLLQSVLEKQEKNDRQLAQSLRDNANFQIQVRQGMQQDLDKLKEQMNGEQFNPLLKEIAAVYVEYQSLLNDETISDRSRKNLHSLFEQLEDILGDYDAEVCRSEVGVTRQTRSCKIIEKIPTGQQEKHNTIAASRKPGVVRDRAVLYPEFVDVFVYDPSLSEASTYAAEEVKENDAPNNDNVGGNEK